MEKMCIRDRYNSDKIITEDQYKNICKKIISVYINKIKKSKPILIYYNDESIQNTAFEFEFIYLDSEGNKIERY